MHNLDFITAGVPLNRAKKALIMVHGRGGTAEDILSISEHLHVDDFALIAPRGTRNSWYPYSFLMPPIQNEPWLSSALGILDQLCIQLVEGGIAMEQIYFLGFSQGACLTLEYVGRHGRKYGGVVGFTGGLIGDKVDSQNYQGDFAGTPIFIGSSNPDSHIPVQRVLDTVAILESHHARVNYTLYEGMGHTICQDEIDQANTLIFTP
ncbi:MAG: dienelactone hydrolase family protein [Bacteroidota bacterium]|nr:dienelactone hydrolase family protein [Bacteroidota bacterium]